MSEAVINVPPEEEVRSRLLLLGEISPPPAIAHELIRLVGNDHAELEDVVKVVEKSPEMTTRILRWANSAYYGERNKIISVKDGIIRILGISTAKSLLLAQALASSFETRNIAFFPKDRFWYLAVTTATLSQELVHHHFRDRLSPGLAYTAGLIHNIGLLALVTVFPGELRPVFSDGKRAPVDSLIYQKIGIDPGMAGAWLSRKWGLPEDFVRVMRYQKDRSYNGQQWELVRLIGLAAIVADFQLGGKALSDLPPECRDDKVIDFAALFAVVEHLNKRLEELKKFSQLLV